MDDRYTQSDSPVIHSSPHDYQLFIDLDDVNPVAR